MNNWQLGWLKKMLNLKEWKHTMWPPLECHIILLFRDVHVWMYPTSNFQNIFTIFLHIMLEYNQNKILKKKLFHFILQSVRLKCNCGNECNVHVYSKTQIYSKTNLNDF
jgi:hypothetical protein